MVVALLYSLILNSLYLWVAAVGSWSGRLVRVKEKENFTEEHFRKDFLNVSYSETDQRMSTTKFA